MSSRSLPREVELGKQILSQNSTGKYGDIGHTSFLRLPRFRSVVVITCVSHAQGPRFEPGRNHLAPVIVDTSVRRSKKKVSFVFVTGSDSRPQLNRVRHAAGLLLSGNLFYCWLARLLYSCLLYTSPSPRDGLLSRMPSSA